MPGLAERSEGKRGPLAAEAFFSRCAAPHCATGWMRLWRSRHAPRFDGSWTCSAECMREVVAAAVRREAGEEGRPLRYTHRVPLGLMLVEQGAITREELRRALEGQRQEAAAGRRMRLGEWLVRAGRIDEELLARVLAAQWGSPVLHLEGFRAAQAATALPPFLAEALGAVPAGVSAGRQLYLAFADGVDRSLSYAIERMTGLPVTAGVALDSEFARAQAGYLAAPVPRERFLEAVGNDALVRAVTRLIEAEKPAEARLVRVHGWYWLRLWRRTPAAGLPAPGEFEDLIGTVGPLGQPGR